MPSSKPKITIRMSQEQFDAVTSYFEQERTKNPEFTMADILIKGMSPSLGQKGVLAPRAFSKPSVQVIDTTGEPATAEEVPEPEPDPEPNPLIEREYATKLRQEFPSQHEFLMGQKRQGREYRAMSNRDKYSYHVRMRQEAGE